MIDNDELNFRVESKSGVGHTLYLYLYDLFVRNAGWLSFNCVLREYSMGCLQVEAVRRTKSDEDTCFMVQGQTKQASTKPPVSVLQYHLRDDTDYGVLQSGE